jgi:hypothetical protein
MNLYLISQTENDDWDTFDSAVVAAPDEEIARNMSPSTGGPCDWENKNSYMWAFKPENVTVKLIGKAIKGTIQGVICSSFRAG